MNSAIEYIASQANLFGTLIVAAATVALAILTFRYVRLTAALVEENRRAREPLVGIDFELPDHGLRMVVANYGQSPAKNVRIKVLQDVTWLSRKEKEGFADTAAVSDGLSYLAPGRKLRYMLGYPKWNGVASDDMIARFQVQYENMFGHSTTHEMAFDFSQLNNVLFESFRDPVLRVADAIDSAIQRQASDRHMEQFVSRMRPLNGCPTCKEPVHEDAKKCPNCHEWIKEA